MTDLPATLPRFSLVQLGKLAREVATDVRELADVLHDFELTEDQFQHLQEKTPFGNMLKAAIQEWNSALSAQDRIRILAANALEEQLPMLAARMGNEKEPLSGAVETGKLLAKLADIGEGARHGSASERFTITINLGDDKTLTLENAVRPLEVRPLPEGAGAEGEVRQITDGTSTEGEVWSDPAEQNTPPAVRQEPEGEAGVPEVRPSAAGERAYEALFALAQSITDPTPVQTEG